MRRIGGVALTVTGFLACPCHLIITLPWLASLLAGTALGSFLSQNTGLVYTGAGIYFVMALVLGYWFLLGPKRSKHEVDTTCPTCTLGDSETPVQKSSAKNWNCPHFCVGREQQPDVRWQEKAELHPAWLTPVP